MMNLQSSKNVDLSWTEAQELAKEPQFRKATRNMILGYATLKRLLDENRDVFAGVDPESIGLVFTTVLGELQQTVDFLETWKNTGLARPTVFQNSLHNSTAGFLMIHFGWKGPLLTSCAKGSSEKLISSLISSGQCSTCIELEIESTVPGLESQLESYVGDHDFARAKIHYQIRA